MARSYASRNGRFTSPDPILGDPREPQSWNRYVYGLNDSINNIDPDGLTCVNGKDENGKDCISVNVTSLGPDTIPLFSPPGMRITYRRTVREYDGLRGESVVTITGVGGSTTQPTVTTQTPAPANNCAQTPPGTPSKYCAPLQQGLDAAKKALQKNSCSASYGGHGRLSLDATQYRFLDLHNPATGAATIDFKNVFINSNGPYMNYTPTPGTIGPFGRYWTQSQFCGFIPLHELGHQLSTITGFRPDAGSPLNQMQSGRVLAQRKILVTKEGGNTQHNARLNADPLVIKHLGDRF